VANTLKDKGQQLVYLIINPMIKLLMKLGITPNMITFLGLVINIAATVIFIYGAEKAQRGDFRYVAYFGVTVLIAGLMDMVDGRLARMSGTSNKYGALYDSVLDRYSELIMFLGICYYLISHDYFLSSLAAFVAMIGSIMVSYTRARAEALGVNCSVGLMQRPERILLVSISAIVCGVVYHFYGMHKIDVDWLPFPIYETISLFTFPSLIGKCYCNQKIEVC
jgi:phosphatidylglycerophosphate synthase